MAWYGVPLANIGACTAAKKRIYAHTEKNNYGFIVRHPRAVADMIERMRLNGEESVLDMIMYGGGDGTDDRAEPIKVRV